MYTGPSPGPGAGPGPSPCTDTLGPYKRAVAEEEVVVVMVEASAYNAFWGRGKREGKRDEGERKEGKLGE